MQKESTERIKNLSTVEQNRCDIIKKMNDIILSMNNEYAYMRWIYIVPDEATEEDFIDIAKNEELSNEVTEFFCKLIEKYGKDGFYFG